MKSEIVVSNSLFVDFRDFFGETAPLASGQRQLSLNRRKIAREQQEETAQITGGKQVEKQEEELEGH